MRRRNVAIGLVVVGAIVFAFLVPFIPMWVLLPPRPCQGSVCLDVIMQAWGYGSLTYYLFGLGATYHAGTYAFTIGK